MTLLKYSFSIVRCNEVFDSHRALQRTRTRARTSPQRRPLLQLRLTMVSPTLYKGLAIFDKAKSRPEGVTPHAATYHAPSRLFFVSTSRRSIFMPHLPPPEDVAEDAHAAFAYRLAEAVARAHKGEPRFQLRGLSPDGLAAECEHKFKPLEHVLCLDTVRPLCFADSVSRLRQTCLRPLELYHARHSLLKYLSNSARRGRGAAHSVISSGGTHRVRVRRR